MVQYQLLDRKLTALSDQTRRDILVRLGSGPASVSDLARPYEMSLTGFLKHVRILEDARLVTTVKRGRVRECSLGPEQLEDVMQWISFYRKLWKGRMDGLESFLANKGTQQ